MAVEIGTATSHKDLLVKLNTFLTTNATLVTDGEAWVNMHPEGLVLDEYMWKGPGLTGLEEIYVIARTEDDDVNGYYSLKLRGSVGFLTMPPATITGQPLDCADVYIPMWNNTMDYWFIANGQRFIIVAKVASAYVGGYFGKLKSYFRTGDYPYPVFIGGMASSNTSYYSTGITWPFKPTYLSAYLFTINSTWTRCVNSTTDDTVNSTTTWPHSYAVANDNRIERLVPFDSGDRVILPNVIISDIATTYNIVPGETDGMLVCPGPNLIAESVITIDAIDYMLFPSGIRVGTLDFVAIRMV
jgi:hypothetical protein